MQKKIQKWPIVQTCMNVHKSYEYTLKMKSCSELRLGLVAKYKNLWGHAARYVP